MNFNDLKQQLSEVPADKIVFVGLGNWMRCDDAAGLVLTEQIENSGAFYNSHFIKADTTPENCLARILQHDPQLIIMIDSADWGGSPGDITWISNEKIDNANISTHSYSISLIEKYLKANGPSEVKYLVIQPYKMDFGFALSEQVEKKLSQFFN